jgi:hypothetical protein
LALTSADALAWGLHTHVWFAQLLLWAVPLADARWQRALRRFPRLVLAGACLPDLSLVSGVAKLEALEATHGWHSAAHVLAAARGDEARALAVGYACHLLTDIVAHNHFVPLHQQLWHENALLTHAAAEWTADVHVGPQLFVQPGELLRSEAPLAAAFIARAFGCSADDAARAMAWLARGEALLRGSRLPRLLHATAQRVDRRFERRLHRFLRHTARRLGQLDRLLAGERPAWGAEVCSSLARLRLLHAGGLRAGLAVPADFFYAPSTAAASVAPMAAPASTSLG